MKKIKVKKFREQYKDEYKDENGYLTLDQWQEKNPLIKIVDTKLVTLEKNYSENFLVVTYEEADEKEN